MRSSSTKPQKDQKDLARVKRLSIDRGRRSTVHCKATVMIGAYSRGGKTRGDRFAQDHDMGCQEKYIPCGIALFCQTPKTFVISKI